MKGRGEEMEVSLEGETDPQDDHWKPARREQRHAKQSRGQCGRAERLKRAMMEGKDGGKTWEEKDQDPDRDPRTKKTRDGKSWLEQQQAKSWGVGPATSQAPADFGWGGGVRVHGAPALVGGPAEYLIVPGARLYTTLQQLHKAYTLAAERPPGGDSQLAGSPVAGLQPD